MRRALLLSLVALVVSAGAGLWWRWRTAGPQAGVESTARTMGAASSNVAAAPPRGNVTIDPRRQQLVGVRTITVSRSPIEASIRASGTLRHDETRIVDVNAKLEGWIRDLTANYTGQAVRAGETLLSLYSPDLLAASQEYLLALRSRDDLGGAVVPDARRRADSLASAARQRLTRWDVRAEDIEAIARDRRPLDALTVRSPIDGVVLEKPATRGAHVSTGDTLFKIADLTVLWLEADLYAADQDRITVGSRATVTFEGSPERTTARAVYVDPYVDNETRTTRVRFELSNPHGRLRPGMYASVEFATSGPSALTVPADAVLDSGREQIVFVTDDAGHFTPRPVTVGRRVGNAVEIVSGLKEGEDIATGATFFLDSESQLRGALLGMTTAPATEGTTLEATRSRITLRTVPAAPVTGENQFEVHVMDASGRPVSDATVSVQLFMPAMPTMNMPAMKNEVSLSAAGAGVYRGTGQVLMAGRWEATVIVTRPGQRPENLNVPIVAR